MDAAMKRIGTFGFAFSPGPRSTTRPPGRQSGTSRAIASIRGSGRLIRLTLPPSRCGTTMRSGPPDGSRVQRRDDPGNRSHRRVQRPRRRKGHRRRHAEAARQILRTYLPPSNPIVTPRLENNRLSFENAAVAADVARAPEVYRASWFHFDNATGESRPLAETTSATTTIDAPVALPTAASSFILIELSADSREHEAWRRPIRTYFRLDADGWKLVGLDRMPDQSRGRRRAAACRAVTNGVEGCTSQAAACHDVEGHTLPGDRAWTITGRAWGSPISRSRARSGDGAAWPPLEKRSVCERRCCRRRASR